MAFVLNHIIPRHTRWPYKDGSQRWRITAAAISIVHAALTVQPHLHSGVGVGETLVLHQGLIMLIAMTEAEGSS